MFDFLGDARSRAEISIIFASIAKTANYSGITDNLQIGLMLHWSLPTYVALVPTYVCCTGPHLCMLPWSLPTYFALVPTCVCCPGAYLRILHWSPPVYVALVPTYVYVALVPTYVFCTGPHLCMLPWCLPMCMLPWSLPTYFALVPTYAPHCNHYTQEYMPLVASYCIS